MRWETMLLALALGADSFCLSFGLGGLEVDKARIWLFTGLVGLLHTVFPLLGFLIGYTALNYLGTFTRLIGAGILIIMGVKIIMATRKQAICGQKTFLKSWDMGILALGVSVDSLLVGFGLGAFGYDCLDVALTFGLTAAFLTRLAFFIGSRVRDFTDNCGYITGLILIVLGIKAFLSP